jgi:dUTP pyrophosphatase
MRGDQAVSIEVRIVRLPHAADLPLPAYQSAQAAGLDLLAAVPADAPIEIAPLGRAMIPAGVAIALPPDSEAQIRPRSGLAARHGITVLNAPGTIDTDYRGEIQVILVNLGSESFVIQRGMRIAQIVFSAIQHVTLVESTSLDSTERAMHGFGSTGTMPNIVNKRD